MKYYPKYPLYVVSKGRSKYMMTSKALTKMNLHHYVVVESQQYDDYAESVKKMDLSVTLLVLDLSYKDRYELCDGLGQTRSTGPGPARNFAWQHSIDSGFGWHWVMDDNISCFRIFQRNLKIKTYTPSFFAAMEDFILRYKNVAMGGPNYTCFTCEKSKYKQFSINTRIYSCNFIRNTLTNRWRGRYNEDTILSLDLLKKGWCTIQFYMFLQEKSPTQTMGGGNTEDFYHREGVKVRRDDKYAMGGTTAKSVMLAKVHPDVAKVTRRYGRIHHQVAYGSFKKNRLIKKDGLKIIPRDYGLKLVKEVK